MTFIPGPTAFALWFVASAWLAGLIAALRRLRQPVELAQAIDWLLGAAAIFLVIQLAAALVAVLVL